MDPDPRKADDDKRRFNVVDRMAVLVASDHKVWQRTPPQGLPRWADWSLALTMVLGVAAGACVFVVSRSWLAARVLLGVC